MSHEHRVFAQYYDLFYLRRKDYESEARVIERIITEEGLPQTRTLLDAGCGTGEHLKHLSTRFSCTGLDINKRMVELAAGKVPAAKFCVGDMVSFKLDARFDVITCLFSSIGYVRTLRNLVKTLTNFRRHLKEGGLVVVEPWVFKADFIEGHMSLDTVEDGGVKFVRMAQSRLTEHEWTVEMHYLIGEEGAIRHEVEVHKMVALDREDYMQAFKTSRFKDVRFLEENLWLNCRGLFTAKK